MTGAQSIAATATKWASTASASARSSSGAGAWTVIDEEADRRDAVILAGCPSRKSFIEMTSTESYGATSKHRTSVLTDGSR
ncbi:MAG: hypothetical protein IVW36_02630 [Dehalococcoidia bacterium]|nr:hypothetical protein [Dehalococcoidia bacterium]